MLRCEGDRCEIVRISYSLLSCAAVAVRIRFPMPWKIRKRPVCHHVSSPCVKIYCLSSGKYKYRVVKKVRDGSNAEVSFYGRFANLRFTGMWGLFNQACPCNSHGDEQALSVYLDGGKFGSWFTSTENRRKSVNL
jgi:hypothetical protein